MRWPGAIRQSGAALVRGAYRVATVPLRRALNAPAPARLVAYRGCGTRRRLWLKGRVVEEADPPPRPPTTSHLRTLRAQTAALLSPGLPGARVALEVEGAGVRLETTTGPGGFFECWIDLPEPVPEGRLWQPVRAELLEPGGPGGAPRPQATSQVLVPPPTARLAVVSDIDDTIMETGVAHKARMLWRIFATDAESRVAFPGVAALYRALFDGLEGERNPIFYVSRGPWSLYGMHERFFELHQIPVGPVLFLRDWGVSWHNPLPALGRGHKLAAIRALLDLYPALPFLLIGDSGQRDAEVYARIAAERPGRVLASYIRNVSEAGRRAEVVAELARRLAEEGGAMVVADDTAAMADHAAAQGWIAPGALAGIRAEAHADAGSSVPLAVPFHGP